MRFSGKNVLVTGGNSGIGRSIVHYFAAEGASVCLVGRSFETGKTVEAEIAAAGGSAFFLQCDLASEDSVRSLVARLADWDRLDVLVNNAGVGARRSGC